MMEEEIIPRKSGQDIGNPNPPSLIESPHEGHKADADAWLRTKNLAYKKKIAKQHLLKDSTDKSLLAIVRSRRQS